MGGSNTDSSYKNELYISTNKWGIKGVVLLGFGHKVENYYGDAAYGHTVVGKWATSTDPTHDRFIVGNGTGTSARHNCFKAGNDGTNDYIYIGDTKITESNVQSVFIKQSLGNAEDWSVDESTIDGYDIRIIDNVLYCQISYQPNDTTKRAILGFDPSSVGFNLTGSSRANFGTELPFFKWSTEPALMGYYGFSGIHPTFEYDSGSGYWHLYLKVDTIPQDMITVRCAFDITPTGLYGYNF